MGVEGWAGNSGSRHLRGRVSTRGRKFCTTPILSSGGEVAEAAPAAASGGQQSGARVRSTSCWRCCWRASRDPRTAPRRKWRRWTGCTCAANPTRPRRQSPVPALCVLLCRRRRGADGAARRRYSAHIKLSERRACVSDTVPPHTGQQRTQRLLHSSLDAADA